MSFTNKTPNFELPQYTADDKPTFLGDFNQAMLKIDTTMKSIDNTAQSANSTSAGAEASAEEALSTANSAKSTAESANSTATTAQNTANNAQTTANQSIETANTAKSTADTAKTDSQTAKTNAQTALNTANNANSKVDEVMTWSPAQNVGNSSVITQGNLLLSFNKGIKCFTIFGAFSFNAQSGETIIGHLPDESLYPVTDRTVYNIAQEVGSGYGSQSIVFKTNGDIVYNAGSPTNLALRMNAFVNYSFWDTP